MELFGELSSQKINDLIYLFETPKETEVSNKCDEF